MKYENEATAKYAIKKLLVSGKIGYHEALTLGLENARKQYVEDFGRDKMYYKLYGKEVSI